MTTETDTREERRKVMAPLSDDDVDRIAQRVKKIMSSEFDIDSKEHYDAHMELTKMAQSFNGARGILTKVFVSMVAIGGVMLAAFSFFGKKLGA